MQIWIDADAAPRAVKDIVYKASDRLRFEVILVANRAQQTPRSSRIRAVQVPGGFDVADEYIVEHVQAGDLVVTSDIPLAAQVVDKGAVALRFRGELLDASNVRQRLQMRDFLDDMRAGGVMTGGPAPFGAKDKQRFANALDRWLAGNHRA